MSSKCNWQKMWSKSTFMNGNSKYLTSISSLCCLFFFRNFCIFPEAGFSPHQFGCDQTSTILLPYHHRAWVAIFMSGDSVSVSLTLPFSPIARWMVNFLQFTKAAYYSLLGLVLRNDAGMSGWNEVERKCVVVLWLRLDWRWSMNVRNLKKSSTRKKEI